MYFAMSSSHHLLRRDGSRDMLTGKLNRTFLVRPKGNVEESSTRPCHTHTIDIVKRRVSSLSVLGYPADRVSICKQLHSIVYV